MSWLSDAFDTLMGFGQDAVQNINWGNVLSLGGSYLLNQSGALSPVNPPVGYQGGIPSYSAVRAPVQNTYDPDRRPGSGGRSYFSDIRYTAPENAASAQTAAETQAQGLAALNAQNPANQLRPTPAQGTATPPPPPQGSPIMRRAPARVIESRPIPLQSGLENFVPQYAAGGIAQLAGGKYLNGGTDGMADQVPANINGQQEARLSDGEFVVPADVVSHLGNGNSDAGAKQLYDMMDRVRKARTGTTKQGKQINPAQYTPR